MSQVYTKDRPLPFAEQRRRLTVSNVDAGGSAPPDATKLARGRPTTNRGLVQFMKANDPFACACTVVGGPSPAQGGGAKTSTGRVSISSETSANQESFAEKTQGKDGDPDACTKDKLTELGVGIGCKKGMKPEAPNQDSYAFVHCPGEFTLYGVFDGHGINGHDVSNFCREYMVKLFLSDPDRDTNTEKAFHNSFRKAQQMLENEMSGQIDARTSGTTATMAYRCLSQVAGQDDSHKLHVAHCGDSRASLVFERKGKISGQEMTHDHKPETPEEKRRIESSGGCVIFDGYYNHRVFKRGTVYPGLNMSRAMGDIIGHKEAGIVETPDYKCYNLKEMPGVTSFMLCSDGVWEFIDCDEVAQMANKHKGKNGKVEPVAAAEAICRESYQRWMDDTGGEVSDDITCLIQVL
ncbi:unnamed protein product [Amoebophrya sp. A25]|nr:unnamed protein product [Amoebophrya sp. A25]|eukprot:GSA25T00025770001.1